MSRPLTRSQGPPEIDSSEEDQPTRAQKRMSRELHVRLETLRLLLARCSKGGETSQLQQQTTSKTVRSASMTLRPLLTIPLTSRSNSVMGIQTTREVSTRFSKYHVVPMHNSTAKDGKQNHTAGLVLPRPEDADETDLEVTEIVEGTMANRDVSKPGLRETTQDRLLFPATDAQSTTDNRHNMTLPSASMFRTINSEDRWLKRYLPDGHNNQIGNVIDREEVTTEDREQWYKIRIPYLQRFYNTEFYLVGKQNDYIYTLRGDEEKEMVCVKILLIPYNLVALEELLRDNQYLRLKGIKRFEEEGENILNKLVSEEESMVPQDIDFTTILSYEDKQKLYERRLKLTKALPIIQQEMCQLENENKDKISLYITQKGEFTTGLHMLIDQIDRFLRKDDERRQGVGLQVLRTPKFYPSGVDLWAEMPVDIIRKAMEDHEECMKSIDNAKNRSQVKHIGIGKTSEKIEYHQLHQLLTGYHHQCVKLRHFRKKEDVKK